MSEALRDTPWQEDGACADLPLDQVDELFFAEGNNGRIPAGAAELCGGCAVRSECLVDALDNPPSHGIRAGFFARDIQKMASGENVVPFPDELV